MDFLNQLHHPEKYYKVFFKWAILGLLISILGGLVATVFGYALQFVTDLRSKATWLIFLLPVGGVLTVLLYRWLKLTKNHGTNEVIDAVLNDKPLSPLIAPGIFIATGLTHLLGGSAGREGAALQLGGSIASQLGKLLKLSDRERTILVMSGMSAVFAGLFGTPLTATLFTMEFAAVGTIFSPALLPCFLSAFAASRISAALGIHPETYLLANAVPITFTVSWQVVVFAILVSVLGIIMCRTFHVAEHLAAKYIPDPLLRILAGGAVITIITLIVGDQRYNGAGMHMALTAVAGQADWYDFLLKLLFTALTLAAGFKGGEIVPTFCIGATFGCWLGGLMGLDPGIAAALGLIGLFCCATNSPLASIILSIEMFGSSNLYLFALVCVIVFVLSGNWGLYSSQVIRYSKARLVRKDIPTDHSK